MEKEVAEVATTLRNMELEETAAVERDEDWTVRLVTEFVGHLLIWTRAYGIWEISKFFGFFWIFLDFFGFLPKTCTRFFQCYLSLGYRVTSLYEVTFFDFFFAYS